MTVNGVEGTSTGSENERKCERGLDFKNEATNRIGQKVRTDHGHDIERREETMGPYSKEDKCVRNSVPIKIELTKDFCRK